MATKALKDKIKKHIEDHLCITDHYAKVAYNVDDLRPIINDLIQLDGMNITSKPYDDNEISVFSGVTTLASTFQLVRTVPTATLALTSREATPDLASLWSQKTQGRQSDDKGCEETQERF